MTMIGRGDVGDAIIYPYYLHLPSQPHQHQLPRSLI
jgi:hypothetical protein